MGHPMKNVRLTPPPPFLVSQAAKRRAPVAGALDSASIVRRPSARASPSGSPALRRPLMGVAHAATPGRGV